MMARRVVVHVLESLDFGGNEALCLQLIRHSPSSVDNVVLYRDPARSDLLPLFHGLPNLLVRCIGDPRDSRMAAVRSLRRELRALRPHAVLVYAFGLHHLVAALGARLAGVANVQASAGNPAPRDGLARWKWRVVLWLSMLLAVPIQAASKSVERSLRELAGRLPAGSATIANGCDVAGIAARAGRARPVRGARDPLVIGMVARLDPIKDQATLIRAFASLAAEMPAVELWLVGDGEMMPALRRLAAALEVADRVVFWGRRADVPELLGQMDVYAFSTTGDEGFGIAVIEAMAAGLPVVASDVAACREVLDGGAAGVLVPPGDAARLAEAVAHLLRSEEGRRRWAARGHQRAAACYSAQRCADDWYRVLLGDALPVAPAPPLESPTGRRT
jgi:glycosyltransferase involved in cell wall biosynthesis